MEKTTNNACGTIADTSGHKRTVVIGHPFLGRGGSEACVMWLIEALKHDHDVTVMTTGGWDLVELNQYYGTNVKPDEVRVRLAPTPLLPKGIMAAALRGAYCSTYAQKIAPEYDVRISAHNLTDWGLPAIHFVADFCWDRRTREALHPSSPGFIYRTTLLRKAYLGLARLCERKSDRDVLRDDIVIANSLWTAGILRERFGVPSAPVVYPPVWTEFPGIAWAAKKPEFVTIGRVAPEKRIEDCIEILQGVRKRGHDIRLRICGHIGTDPYARRVAALCNENRDWIVAEGWVSGERKERILAECRFGIQATHGEGFGISAAEMVKAGAIAFAPNEGGQAEILNREELLFSGKADAVRKIDAVLRDDRLQAELLEYLRDRSQLFGAKVFQAESLDLLAGALASQNLSEEAAGCTRS